MTKVLTIGHTFTLISILLFSCSPPARFEKLLCDYSENPINITDASPAFSWIISSPLRGNRQTAFRIIVTDTPNGIEKRDGILWDTEKITSDETIHQIYHGKSLKSNTSYYWKVIVWDKDDNKIESPVSSFSTAILSDENWPAPWIGAGPDSDPLPPKGFFMEVREQDGLTDTVVHEGTSRLLRKTIHLDKTIKSAIVHVAGLGLYELYINGQKVGDQVLSAAKTNYTKEVLYNTFHIDNLLRKGENVIGIHLGNGWYNPYKHWWMEYRMQWFGSKKATMYMHLCYEDGSEEVIKTDNTWKTAPGPILFNCIYDGEIFDANANPEGWCDRGFDDADWTDARIVQGPAGALRAQRMPAIRVVETIQAEKVLTPMSGMAVYDMGQNFAGWVRIKLRGKKGVRLKMRFAEDIHEDGTIDVTSNEKAQAAATYILKGASREIYEPAFTYYGFQYVELTAEGEMPEIEKLSGCVVHTDNRPVGSFACDYDLINKIHHATVWSQKSNMIGYPMDCPQRDERLGWMGDAQVSAEQAMFNFDMSLFYRNWLTGIRLNQDPETGDIPIISPRPYIHDEGVEWSSTFILMTWQHYLYYGDKRIISDNYHAMSRYMDFLDGISTDHIVPKGWIGDWGSLVDGWREGEPESIPTAFYYFNARTMKKIAHILGRQSDEEKFANLANTIREAYNRKFYHEASGFYNDGSQMANAFPLYLGIVNQNDEQRVLDNLIRDIHVVEKDHLTTGVLGTKYMIEALSMYGRPDIAWDLARQTSYPSWYEMMKRYSTVCEFWTLKQSKNHVMMGSIDAWFYKKLAGIQLIEERPAFKEIVIDPYLADELNTAKAEVNTIRGTVKSAWKRTDLGIQLEMQIPYNTSAVLCLSGDANAVILENGVPLAGLQDIEYLRYDNGKHMIRTLSGVYRFEIRNT